MINLITGTAELGIIYAIMALGVFISFRTLNIPDLTVDSSFTSGAAVSAVLCIAGHPFLGIIAAFVVGLLAGSATSLISTKLGVAPLLSGILMMLALYSINLHIMGKPNLTFSKQSSIFTMLENLKIGEVYAGKLIISLVILLVVFVLMLLFLKTKLGLGLRATGDNEAMVRASGVNTDLMKLIGMALSNGLVALSGGMLAQYQKFADIQMGVGLVVIGLASVIVGEVVFGKSNLARRLAAVALGAVLYRAIIALALQLGMPSSDLRLVSAAIVLIALAAPRYFKGLGRIHLN